MNFKYKDSKSPNSFACSHLYKKHDDSCDLPEEMIIQAQIAFLKILNLNSEDLTDDSRDIFAELEEIANFEKIKSHLPKIIPRSTFPQLVAFLALTNDAFIHKVVSHIIVILLSDATQSLVELQKSDLIGAVDVCMSVFKFPYSTDYLFQIIANFIDDPNPYVSQYAHNLYTIEYLFKIFQYIKSSLKERLENDKDPDIKVDPKEISDLIISKWMLCICTTINKYTEDVPINHAIIALIEVRKYFDIIQKDPFLCKNLCCTIRTLAHANKIDYSDFNGYKFPKFLYKLSCYDSDVSVKINAFLAIGELIALNRFELEIDFYHFFNVVLNSNESTDQNLIISSLYASRCYLVNSISCEYTFEQITDNIQLLFDFYDMTVFQIKDEMNELFSNYIVCFSKFNNNNLLQYEQIIFTITNYFFDLIQISDDAESISSMMNAILELNNYLFITGQNNLPSAIQFINDLNRCIEKLKDSEYNDISELANALLKVSEIDNY